MKNVLDSRAFTLVKTSYPDSYLSTIRHVRDCYAFNFREAVAFLALELRRDEYRRTVSTMTLREWFDRDNVNLAKAAQHQLRARMVHLAHEAVLRG